MANEKKLKKVTNADAAKLKAMDITRMEKSIVCPRIIISVCGLEKQGKTHLALTAPGPMALFNMDVGLEGVINKFCDDKEIYPYDLRVPAPTRATAKEEAEQEWNRFVDIWTQMMDLRSVRTLVVDTATELWDLARVAYFGKLNQVKPHNYVEVNAEFRRIIRMPFESSDKNVILLHKMKKRYVNEKWDGSYERAGFNDVGFLVQADCQIHRLYKRHMKERGFDVEPPFALEILESRHNPRLAEQTFEGPMCSFPFLACQLIEGSAYDDWN